MSWRDYQRRLETSRRRRSGVKALCLWLLGLAALGGGVFILAGLPWGGWTEGLVADRACPVVEQHDPKATIRGLITPAMLATAPSELRVHNGADEWTLQLSLDNDLQTFIQEALARYKVDWAGVAVLDPKSGRVLALAYHSEKDPAIDDLSLRATFPAASIFKIVTSAAALEAGGYRPDSTVAFCGDMYGVNRRTIQRETGPNGMTLGDAFARSANAVFGKIGARDLNAVLLEDYAGRFGFNREIPFEVPLRPSSAEIPHGSEMEEARTAAGFGKVTLSPLHGALLAAAVLNDGMMMEPYLVERAVDGVGQVRFEGRPRVWLTPIQPATAREMRQMMITTVTEGTAHSSFRRTDRDPILSQLQMGGKTGSLTGSDPPGKTEWFVGYARSTSAQLAVGIAIVNDQYWRVKPARLAKEIFAHRFDSLTTREARAAENPPRRL